MDQWVDKATGQNRSAVKLVAQHIVTVVRNPAYPGRTDGGGGAASAAPTYGQVRYLCVTQTSESAPFT